ncbi:PRC-barrel domain-containing protein [Peribacillus sp.]|uniref:PRC-barrel domain-containing protein n=1 Tax=Peribacillus sp. TaxID=2675267 RepID=UPI00388D52D4
MTLRTFSVLKGLPVFTAQGEKIGMVHDLSLSDAGLVNGLVIHRQALFKKELLLALEDIFSFGPDGVVLQQDMTPKKMMDDSIWFSKDQVVGRMLLSEMGDELGLLQDVYFLEKMGTIIAYETTDGFFSESTVIESKQPPTLGKDAIIVSVYEQ